jgi:hypothetical protein
MRSFISSFDYSDLFKAIVTAAIVVLLTWVVLPRHPPYENQLPPSAEVDNEIVVWQYIEHYRDKPVVFVGSSITTEIPDPNCRPQNVASIPLQGRSAVTGLEVIRRVGARPDVVFVEVPQLTIGVDRRLVDTVVTPLYWRIRSFIPPLRYTRNWMILLYQKMQWDLRPFDYTVEIPRETVGEWEQQHAAFFNAVLNTLGQPSTIGDTIAQIEAPVHDLQARGTRVIFFDPVDPRIRNALPERETRDVLRATFPDIPIVDTPDDIPIYRHDGLHVHWSSGLQFFNYLMNYAGISYEPKCTLIGQPVPDIKDAPAAKLR